MEYAEPPSEVCSCVAGGMVGNERVCVERSHEAFQVGEISMAGRDHQASVEKLAVKLLGFFQRMGGVLQPIFDCCSIFGFLFVRDGNRAFK